MAYLAQIADLPETVRESRLNAEFHTDESQRLCTVHAHGRALRRKQVWVHQRVLGTGGFGSVHLQATRSTKSGPPQLRAVKSIPVSKAELELNPKFYTRELETTLKFSQAGYNDLFVKTYGWFTSSTHLFIAMEYLELGDLQKYLIRCPNKRLPEAEAREIASQILDALSCMHEENFSHRDLKPQNILIKSQPPDPWVVKLGDFGISKRVEQKVNTIQATNTTVRGTPGFFAPELGDPTLRCAGTLDFLAADIWCFGETMHRLLAGGPVFDSPKAFCNYVYDDQVFPSQQLRECQVSEHGIAFLSQLIIPKPSDRPTVEQLSSHPWLLEISSSQSYSSLSTSTLESVGFSLDESTTASTDIPSARWSRVMGTSSLGAQKFEASDGSPTGTRMKTHIQGIGEVRLEEPRKYLDPTERILAEQLIVMYESKDLEGAENMARSLISMGKKRHNYHQDLPTIELFRNLAWILIEQNNINKAKEARSLFLSAAEMYSPLVGSKNKDTILCQWGYANASYFLKDFAACQAMMATIIHPAQNVWGMESDEVLQCQVTLALSLNGLRRFAEAEALFRSVIEVRRRQGYGNSNHGLDKAGEVDLVEALHGLGLALFGQSNLDEAEETLQEAIKRYEARFGYTSETVLLWVSGFVRVLEMLDKLEAVECLYADIFEARKASLGPDHGLTLEISDCLEVIRRRRRDSGVTPASTKRNLGGFLRKRLQQPKSWTALMCM